MIRYSHKQFGWVIAVAGVAVVAILLGVSLRVQAPRLLMIIALASATPLLFFSSLTTEVNERFFELRFTAGFVRKKFALADIAACGVVTNPFWYGWGIHLTPNGWLYNVSGTRAVQIDLVSGKRVRVGTDDPEALCAAIRAASNRQMHDRAEPTA